MTALWSGTLEDTSNIAERLAASCSERQTLKVRGKALEDGREPWCGQGYQELVGNEDEVLDRIGHCRAHYDSYYTFLISS